MANPDPTHLSQILVKSVKKEYTVEMDINFNSLEEMYKDDQTVRVYFAKKFDIDIEDSTFHYNCSFCVGDQGINFVGPKKYFIFHLKESESYALSWDLLINDRKPLIGSKKGKKYVDVQSSKTHKVMKIQKAIHIRDKLKSVTGKLTLKFVPSKGKILKQKLMDHYATIEMSEEAADFTLVCKGQEFKFNRNLLAKISSVFKNWTNDAFIEAQNNKVEIMDDHISIETIKAFDRILCSETVLEEDLTTGLFIFCKKYFIEPILNMCRDNLINTLTKETFFDVIQTAYWTDDEELFISSANFVKNNLGTFQDNQEYDTFMKSHPECSVKMMKLMMRQN